MKHTTFIAAILGAAVTVTGTTVLAERAGAGEHMRPSFSDMDTNADGQISLEEITARGEARFAKIDTDGDGMFSEAEAVAAATERAKERHARMVERMDADKDGKLALDEMKPKGDRGARMFERADADNSGGISEEEFAAVTKKMDQHMRKGHKDGHKNWRGKMGDKPVKD
ncbi:MULTISPECIES: EF-hand domain-containing protein [Roseobacteraceae]|jgi:Ca2+-binding EF-hand superfamily protein|uniref:EF hand n=1 Tax=Pseudosulfitobacter pseudonitzschiae TaxID=1402135 RepID=A0A221K1J1_9RHOB|nr:MULTISPECIES: EF-hand domain-containing protein [Roseobacteraceae]ASM72854.1 EF hand [Pseudosulfitobacter pseudonitzschiae]